MIRVILSGEGNSDLGKIDYFTKKLVLAPIGILTEKILLFHKEQDIEFEFIPSCELKRKIMTLKGKKEKKDIKGHFTTAYKLGVFADKENAEKKKYDIAVLMRDASKTKFETVYNQILRGFGESPLKERGVPAVPVSESEAWLICCLEPAISRNIENEKENMKKMLERKLLNVGKKDNEKTRCKLAENCQIAEIEAPSFKMYKDDLKIAVDNV
ncbi:MAG: hypothetical protein ACI86H_002327 [bacterium]|jgi:hypothetical protein